MMNRLEAALEQTYVLLDESHHVLDDLVVIGSLVFRRYLEVIGILKHLVFLGADLLRILETTNNPVVVFVAGHVGNSEGLELLEDRVCQTPDGPLVQQDLIVLLHDVAMVVVIILEIIWSEGG